MSHFYRVFDLLLESSFQLPGMTPMKSGVADLVVQRCTAEELQSGDFEVFHQWLAPSGQVVIEGARRGEEYVLRFPHLAEFELPASLDRIRVAGYAGTEPSTLSHLLLDQVLPRLLNHRGRLAMHASAVELPGGSLVAFAGNSGKGKSSLAASFCAAGFTIAADDCVVLDYTDEGLSCVPAYSSLRLWPDTHAQVFSGRDDFRTYAGYSQKKQLLMASDAESASPRAELSALFLLADQAPASVHIERASGAAGAMSIVESVFALDPTNSSIVQRNLEAAARLMASGLPIYQLHYRRDFRDLPAVRERVMQTVARLPHGALPTAPVRSRG